MIYIYIWYLLFNLYSTSFSKNKLEKDGNNRLIDELENEYTNYINQLLIQKNKIHQKIQESMYNHLLSLLFVSQQQTQNNLIDIKQENHDNDNNDVQQNMHQLTNNDIDITTKNTK